MRGGRYCRLKNLNTLTISSWHDYMKGFKPQSHVMYAYYRSYSVLKTLTIPFYFYYSFSVEGSTNLYNVASCRNPEKCMDVLWSPRSWSPSRVVVVVVVVAAAAVVVVVVFLLILFKMSVWLHVLS